MKLFIFGSTGDLVKRKVMRALQKLNKENLEIYALGRKDMDRKEYQNFICSDWCSIKFKNSLHYLLVNFEDLKLCDYLSKEETNFFYLSLPPSEYKNVLRFINKVYEKGYEVKILLEKPFGDNLEKAEELQEFIENSNIKNNVFISDHYLFKKNFLNLPKDFNKIKIVSIEKVGLENRISYYDSTGAIKDMIQSHFLNLILKNLDFEIDPQKINISNFVKGQYEEYQSELGKKSETETFVSIKFPHENKEFEFITGKAFYKKENYIEIDDDKFIDTEEDNPYVEIFKKFLSSDLDENLMQEFPTMENSILGWKIINKFEEFGKDKKLIFYKKDSELEEVSEEKNS